MIRTVAAIVVCLVSFAVWAQVSTTESGQFPILSVCEALSNRLKYDGQMVRIRAQNTGTTESSNLIGDHCSGSLLTEGYRWDWIISLASPGAGNTIHPINFRFDEASMRRVFLKYEQLRPQLKPHECLVITVTGLFETHEEWTWTRLGTPRGFGHLNGAMAQLVARTYDDVEVVPNCGM